MDPARHSSEEAVAGVSWVVGGTRGIGSAVVERLRQDGGRVVVSGQDSGPLRPEGGSTWSLPVDVRSETAIQSAVASLREEFGRLDAVVVTVREAVQGRFDTLSDDDWRVAIDTKLLGFVRIARHARPLLEEARGTLLVVAGSAATIASPGHPLGCINSALRHVVRTLAMDWAPMGIRVFGVSPGPTRTATLSTLLGQMADERALSVDEVEAEVAKATYRKRMSSPEEIAELIQFLLGGASSPMNGTVIQADDGAVGGCL